MSKSNKELAVEVAIELIKANPKLVYGINVPKISNAIDLKSVVNIINTVNSTLEEIDKNNSIINFNKDLAYLQNSFFFFFCQIL